MGLVRRLGGAALPVGSNRRARVTGLARATGVWAGPADTDYQRWTRTVEPALFSPVRAVASGSDPYVHVELVVDASVSVAELERSVLSLAAQTYAHWHASITASGDVGADVRAACERLVASEPRLTRDALDEVPTDAGAGALTLSLRGGDSLAPAALNEVLLAFAANPTADTVLADVDRLAASGDQRIDPIRIDAVDPDAARQFDLLSAFAAFRGVARASVAERLAAGDVTRVVLIPLVLVHRRHRVGPPVVQLDSAPVDELRRALADRATVDAGGLGLGTRVRHRCREATIAAIVRAPVDGSAGAAHRHVLASSLDATQGIAAALLHAEPCALDATGRELAARARELGADVVLVLDGSLQLGSPDALDDLLGVLQRDDVVAVAPIVTVPSGLVVDAGCTRRADGWKARCGGLFRPPFDLPWTRAVDALSGRVVLIGVDDLDAIGDRPLGVDALAALAAATGRRLVIWPHQRAIVTAGLSTRDAGAPSAAAWFDGRLAAWFGPGIAGYRPLNDSKGEAAW